MPLYSITARRINDRPDENGWTSSGHDLPAFFVDAVSAFNAASIGHDIAGHGSRELTRTTVNAYRVAEDGTDDAASTTWWWANGDRVHPTKIMRRYGKVGQDITSQPLYAEEDADAVTWFTEDGNVFTSLNRSPRGKWAIDTANTRLWVSDYRRRFDSPDDALYFVERRMNTRVVEVTEW